MRSAFPLAAAAVAVVVLLSGCVPEGTAVVPPPATSADPVFASDEEALAAATEAYTAYLAMSDLIAQEGGKNPERIAPYVTEEWLAEEVRGNEALIGSGRKLMGSFKVTATSLQQVSSGESMPALVVIYACLDPSGARLLDAGGAEVSPRLFGSPWVTEATLESRPDAPSRLLVSRDEQWSDDSLCL